MIARLLLAFSSYFFECGCNFVEVDLFRDILRSELWLLTLLGNHPGSSSIGCHSVLDVWSNNSNSSTTVKASRKIFF
jgi:hypothetical protein